MAKKRMMDKDGEEEWQDFKKSFYKVIWRIFVVTKVPIILVWLALIIGIVVGSVAKC